MPQSCVIFKYKKIKPDLELRVKTSTD